MKTRTSEYLDKWTLRPPTFPWLCFTCPVFKASTDLENEGCRRKDLKAERAKSSIASLRFRIRNERRAFPLLRDCVWSVACALHICIIELRCFFYSFLSELPSLALFSLCRRLIAWAGAAGYCVVIRCVALHYICWPMDTSEEYRDLIYPFSLYCFCFRMVVPWAGRAC